MRHERVADGEDFLLATKKRVGGIKSEDFVIQNFLLKFK